MNEAELTSLPAVLKSIEEDTKRIDFGMASERPTGALLRVLAASKPAAQILELGTGTGISAAWLLDGMDQHSHLTTVDNDGSAVEIAKRHLGSDHRITFHIGDGAEFLVQAQGLQFEMIFADTWPGKFTHLELALSLLKKGGFYVVDDLLPQANWPDGHASRIPPLLESLAHNNSLAICPIAWSTGLVIAVKII
jgi:predicted O-methyltransferase YrrM